MASEDARPASASGPRVAGIVVLRVPAEFTRCLGVPPLHRSGPFALHFARIVDGSGTTSPVWRLGLVIPKRYEKSAVARNTIKRRWRAAFRQCHALMSAEFGSADLVVRLRAPLLPKSTATDVAAALKPAKRRARALFEPQAMLLALAERLRRGGPPKPATRTNVS